MASKLPVVAPRHSSLVEIIGANEERGWLVPAGGFGHTVLLGPGDNNQVRPVVDHEEMADRIRKVMDYPNQSAKKIQAAFDWVPTWDEVGQEWVKMFEKASMSDWADVKSVDAPLVGVSEEVTTAP
jgi:glycosyltransferase involved in cell wall biosynthesis